MLSTPLMWYSERNRKSGDLLQQILRFDFNARRIEHAAAREFQAAIEHP